MLLLLILPAIAFAEDDGEEYLRLMEDPRTRDVALVYLDDVTGEWDGSLFCIARGNPKAPDDARSAAFTAEPLHLGKEGFVLSVQEELVEEADTRPNAKKSARVLRSFYVVAEMEITDKARNIAVLRRRFWFDRNENLHLRRQQVFDNSGKIVTDVRYTNYLKLDSNSPILRPSVVEVRRPYDKYSAELNFLTDSTEFNVEDLPATAFILENDQKLPETDLDKRP